MCGHCEGYVLRESLTRESREFLSVKKYTPRIAHELGQDSEKGSFSRTIRAYESVKGAITEGQRE